MELLIVLYDNALIYYPNIFLPAIILVGALTLLLVLKFIVIFSKIIIIIFKELISDAGQLRKIKHNVKFSPTDRIITLLKLLIEHIRKSLSSMNVFAKYLEQKIRELVKRIGKEVLVD